jgi:hypothetical protein
MGCMQDVDEKTMDPIRPRWSDCQCPGCAVLLMPFKVAQSKLFVRCDDMTSGKERCTNGSGEEFEVNTDISKNSLKPMFASPIAAPNPQHNTATRGNNHSKNSFRSLAQSMHSDYDFLESSFCLFLQFLAMWFMKILEDTCSP